MLIKMLINKGFITKTATSFSFLFAVLLLLSLPGESKESNANNARWGNPPRGLSLAPTLTPANPEATAVSGFSYSQWLSTGQPLANENWASGTFILRPTAETYQSRLSAAWRNAGVRAGDVQPLLRDELLLSANNKENHWQATWQNHREAALRSLVDGTTDAFLGGVLADGRALSWVHHLEGDFRTTLGDRPWSFGINAILALHERKEDATGLQLRGYFSDDSQGANAGLFYRRRSGDALLVGGNAFLDYERDNDSGDFWRWSLGLEWRTAYLDFYGNRYLGITEGKRQSDGTYIYTASGTDVELVLKTPFAQGLSGILGYYQWDGEYGDKDERGLRYGLRIEPKNIGGLSFELQYEKPKEGGDSWGGQVSYSHDFGKGPESAAATEALTFDPRAHFFDSVRREYTQRLRKTGNVLTGRIIITQVNGQATLIGSELSLKIAGDGENFTTELALISTTINGGITTTVTGTVTTQTVTDPNDYSITATARVTAFTQSSSTLRLSVNDWAIELHSQLAFLHDSPTMTLVEGELEILRNNNNGISKIALTNGIIFNLTNNALVSIATGPTVTLALISGMASLVLNAGHTLDAMVGYGTLIVSVATGASVAASVGSIAGGEIILISGGTTVKILPLAGNIINPRIVVSTGYTGLLAQITTTGGSNLGYSLVIGGGTFTIGATDGLLSLALSQSSPTTLSALVQVTDTGTLGVRATPVTVGYTVLVGEALRFSLDKAGVTITTHDNNRALLTASAAGQLSVLGYALMSTAPAGFAANFAVLADSGIISLQQAVTTATTLSLYIRASEQLGSGISRAATLLLTVIAKAPPVFAATLDNTAPVLIIGNNGLVAQVNSTGGKGTHTYTIQPAGGNLTVGTNGLITLLTAVVTPTTLSATLVANDGHPNTLPVTLSLTLKIVNALGFTPSRLSLRLTTHGTVPVALHTAVATNPLGGTITYALISTAPAGFTSIDFTPANRAVSLTATLSTTVDVSIYIRATTATEQATLILQLGVVNPPAINAVLISASSAFLTGETGKVASVSVTGGQGAYTYTVSEASQFTVGTDGLVTLTPAQSDAATLTATVVVNDTHANTVPVSLSLTLTLVKPVSFSPDKAGVTLTTHDSVPLTLHQANIEGGLGTEIYALVSTNPVAFSLNISIDSGNGQITLTQRLSSQITASVYVRGAAATFGGSATLLLTVIAKDPPAFAAVLDNTAPLLTTGNKGLVAQVNSTGGKGAYTYTIQPTGGNLTIGTDGRISLLTAAITSINLPATIVANDSHPNTPAVLLSLTLSIYAVPAFVNASVVVLTGYTGAVASIINAPSGGLTVIFGGDNFTLSTDGELSLTMAITISSTLTASVLVDDGTRTITLGYTLNVGSCSFFSGCAPFVSHDGAAGGLAGKNIWLSLSVTTAQALIAAGADVNEVLSYTNDASNHGTERPLFAVARYGNAGVASVLLAAGANVSAVIQYTQDSAAFSNVGILFEEFHRNPSDINIFPQASLFVTHGADVFHKTRFNGFDVTPLDIYNFRSGSIDDDDNFELAADFIKGFGAKCLNTSFCKSNDIRLAAVSFAPTSVVVTSTMTGALHTVQAATGLGTSFNYRIISTFPIGFTSNYSAVSVDVNSAILNLNSLLDFSQTISIFIEATDQPSGAKATFRYIHIIPKPSFVNASAAVLFSYTGQVASITNALPSSGFSVVFGNANFTIGADGALSLTTTSAVTTTLTASVVIDASPRPLMTLDYTLKVHLCSFFTPGCQPFVNFDGARAGGADTALNHPGRAAWSAITTPLAQSLIAAGANINETSPTDNDTPLLAVARYGNAGVASVLLTAGANVNALGRYIDTSASNTDITLSKVGVLEYVRLNATNINPLVSLFVANGVSVNIRVGINGNQNLTPLDYFNDNSHAVAASAIEAAGAKCNTHCRAGDLSLATVSFSPTALTLVVGATQTGALHTVQAATGLGTRLSYQLLSISPVSFSSSFSAISLDVNSTALSLDATLGASRGNITVYVEATDNNTTTDKATLRINIAE